MKLVVQGEVGGPGDYADLSIEALVEQLAGRVPLEVTVVSRGVPAAAERLGWGVVPAVTLSGGHVSDEWLDARAAAVLAGARGELEAIEWSDPAWQSIHAVAAADAVVLSWADGGRLDDPARIYESAVLAALADVFEKPCVFSNFPVVDGISDRQASVLGQALRSAAFVGCRDAAARDRALAWGVRSERAVGVIDDVSYVGFEGVLSGLPSTPYVLATVTDSGSLVADDQFVRGLGELVAGLALPGGLSVVIVPSGAGQTSADAGHELVLCERLAAALADCEVRVVQLSSRRMIGAAVRGAEFVVACDWQAVTFALSAGVPAIGLATGSSVSCAISGAMENFGFDDFSLSVASLLDGGGRDAAIELGERGPSARAHLEGAGSARRRETASWWDLIANLKTAGSLPGGTWDVATLERFTGGAWVDDAVGLRNWTDHIVSGVEHLAAQAAEARIASGNLEARAAGLELELAEMAADLALATEEVESLRSSAQAAQRLVAERIKPLEQVAADLPKLESLAEQLDALYHTRTFRYLNGPRTLYRRLRRVR